MRTFNWGILGTGHIAAKFVEGLRSAAGANVYAVASRDLIKAQEFAAEHGITVAHGSYESLVEDPDVDIVYIATPNNLHYPNTLMCINAGKATLCEKPFALNSDQLEKMVSLARHKNIFLMEALWTRFLPTITKVVNLVGSGEIGDIHMVKADFGFKAAYSPEGRLFNKELGGGALLDIGIYPVFLALLLLGKPRTVKSLATKSPTGTDLTNAITMTHANGGVSVLASSFAVNLETEAIIVGTEGCITLHRMFHMPTRISVTRNGETRDVPVELRGNGYNYEAEEVMNCLRNGRTESNILTLDFSIELMGVLEEITSQF